MNLDLAVMALDGLVKSPLKVSVEDGVVSVRGAGEGFRELARLCLLLGSDTAETGDEFELRAPLHLHEGSSELRLKRS